VGIKFRGNSHGNQITGDFNMTAFTLLGNTDQYDLEKVQEIIDRIYPADSCDQNGLVDPEIAALASNQGFTVEAIDGDQYEKNQWLKVAADFKVSEPDKDTPEKDWERFEFLSEELSKSETIAAQKFIAALRTEL
jgi:hypothetical protein